MRFIFYFFLLGVSVLFLSCNENDKIRFKTYRETFELYGDVKKVSLNTQYFVEKRNNEFDTFSNPAYPIDILGKTHFDINFTLDGSPTSITTKDNSYNATFIKINDSITHIVINDNKEKYLRIQTKSDTSISVKTYNENNHLIESSEIILDSANHQTNFNIYNPDGKILLQKVAHIDNEINVMQLDVKKYTLDDPSQAPLIKKYHYKFDKENRGFRECSFEDYYGEHKNYEYQYKFDEHNNWIEKSATYNGKKIFTTTRNISYFPI